MPDSTPETDPVSTGNPDQAPSYTTPTPNPRDVNDLGRSMRPKFEFAQNPALSEQRVHPDATRNPLNGRITKSLHNRSK